MTDRYPTTMHIPSDMIEKIDSPIDPALVSRRPGGGSTTQAYLKGDVIADQLNTVFGPLGWSKGSSIHTVDDWDEDRTVQRNNQPTTVNMHMVQVISNVTLTIKKATPDSSDTIFIEQGVGYGEIEAGKSRKEAFAMAVKGASTDGLKRCASLLGKAFGMMMSSSGKQDDIDYAHNNKPNDIKNARNMRGGTSANASAPAREDNRGNGGNGTRDAGRDAGRDEGRGNARNETRSNGRESAARDNAPRDTAPRDSAPTNQEVRNPAPREKPAEEVQREDRAAANADAAKPSEQAPASSAPAKPKAARRTASTTYPLDSVPVTLDDQTDFGATLASRVKEMRQKSDKEGLVKQHLNTIRNLDGPIRKRLTELLSAEGVDADRIAS